MLSGCGKKPGGIYDFEGQDPQVIDPWKYIQDTELSSDPILINFASSASNLGITIGVIGIIFSILYMAIRISITHSPKKKEEIKQEAMVKGIIGIMIFSIPLWLGIIKNLGDLLVK